MKTFKEMNDYCDKRDAFRKILDTITDIEDLRIFHMDLATRSKQLKKEAA